MRLAPLSHTKGEETMQPGVAPRATYRLRLTKNFIFRQAGGLAPYLQRLGISHASVADTQSASGKYPWL